MIPNESTTAPDGPTLTNSAAPLPATAATRYQFLEEIARGGMGVVYRATDTVLDREVAVKVLGERFEPESSAARRFLDEARIAGQLQHPGIPAVHDLGSLPDGRPFLAMKLVKGNTLEALLAAGGTAAAERGRFVAVFEQICQAIGYAHAHQVIHRDLKPANVMVGAFGEVQVMDWGLAKVLVSRERQRPEAAADETAAGTRIHSLRDSDGSGTQAGSILGTPAFMPPEQAIGAVDQIDARSDVFGLGAILAVILTGQPPFVGDTAESTRQAAAKGKVLDAFGRLDACGAEPELVALCKRCLAAEKHDRPADGAAVATAVAGLRAAADERARQAELDRVRAEGERAKAEAETREQRKRRRVQLALAAAVVLLLLGGGAFAFWQAEQGRAGRERLGRNAEAEAGLLDQCEAALRSNDAAKATVAFEAAKKRAGEGGADDLAERLDRCEQDLKVLRALDAVDQFRWTPVDNKFPEGPAVVAQYRDVLRHFGADPERAVAKEAAARVSASAVRERLVAALDWAMIADSTGWVRTVLAAVDPDPYRDAVRDAIQARDRKAAAELPGRPDALVQPPAFAAFLSDIRVAQVERQRALLGAAVRRQPDNLSVLMALGNTYPINAKEGAEERVRWFQAAVAVAPTNAAAHTNLGVALDDKQDLDGAIAEYRESIRLDRTYASAHIGLGNALHDMKDQQGAIAEFRESIRLDPRIALAHYNLGNVLHDMKDLEGAIAEFRESIRLDAKFAPCHINLGNVLREKKDLEGAIAEYREGIRLDPKLANAHSGLGHALHDKKDLEGAIAEYREAIRLDPKLALAHNGLGNALWDIKDVEGAFVAFREAVRLDPKVALAHNNLGNALHAKKDLEGAIAEHREALRLDPKLALAHNGLGVALMDKKDVEGAIAALREAVRLDPTYAHAHDNLGNALHAKKDLEGAIAEHREALRLDPKDASMHSNLGITLSEKGDLEGAIAEFREAIRLLPMDGAPHNNLGLALWEKQDLEGAIAEFREALRVDPKDAQARFNLHRVERMRELLPRLPDILAGRAEPKTPAEGCEFANLSAQSFQNRFAASARLYDAAFTADPKLADDLVAGHRYDAACFAARAARGDGVEAPTDAAPRVGLRAKALAWLRADLALRRKQAASLSAAGERQTVAEKLTYWLGDTDLSGVRPGLGRMGMADAERADWDKFWAEVRATRDEALKPPPPLEVLPPPREVKEE